MSAPRSFKPSVRHYQGKFEATLPVHFRSDAWKILFKIQDHVIEISRDSGPTKLIVSENPGYENEDALAILTVAIYAAVAGFDQIIDTKANNHLSFVESIIDFHNCKVDRPFFDLYLGVYIQTYAMMNVNKAFETIRQGWQISYFEELSSQVEKAKRAIEFIPLTSFAITPWEKSRRVKFCKDVLRDIESHIASAKDINHRIAAIRKYAKVEVEQFEQTLSANPLSISGSYHRIMNSLSTSEQMSEVHFEHLSTGPVENIVHQAIALSPLALK